MTSKYVLCFAILIAVIEAFPLPRYVALPIDEYEALIYGQPETQIHSYRVAATPRVSRQKRSNTHYAGSVIDEVVVEPEYVHINPFAGGYKQQQSLSDLHPFTGWGSQVIYVEEDPSGEFSADLDQAASATHEKRDAGYSASGDDHVDYGAYTGNHGAFGWYSDHPVLVHR